MRTLLILTDFSEAAFRAAEYACEWVDPLQVGRMVVFHAYQHVKVMAAEMATGAAVTQEPDVYLQSMESLGLLHDRLRPLVRKDIQIDLLAEEASSWPEMINQLCRRELIDLIVMGVSGKSGLDKLLMGSITAQVLQAGEYPVLIVPQNALLGRGVQSIVFSTDLKDFSTTSASLLHTFLDAFPAVLHVVNVMPEAREKYSPETEQTIDQLHVSLDKYQSAFHYVHGEDIVTGILSFSEQQHASLIITIPRKHGFITGLFHRSIAKKLAYNSSIPLLALPSID